MKLRAATNEDEDEVTELIFSVLKEYGLRSDSESTDADLLDIQGHYAERGGFFDVCEDESGAIIATVGVHRINAVECELRKMYVNPRFRGQGIGRLLLDHAIGKASEFGYGAMTLETASVLKEAIGLYRRYGFQPVDPDHLSSRCDQAFRKELGK